MKLSIIATIILALSINCSKPYDNFSFKDSNECLYRIDSLQIDFQKCYGTGYSPNVLVVVSNKDGQSEYDQQLLSFSSNSFEELNLIIVRGYDNKTDKSGYYLGIDHAKKMLGKNNFIVYLYSTKGKLLYKTTSIIPYQQIKQIL